MKQQTGTVEVKLKTADGTEKVEQDTVTYPEFETSQDVLDFISTGDAEKDKANLADLLAAANYGFNLKARASVRSRLLDKLAGPDKAINKAIADIMKMKAAMGKPITEEKARALVLALQDAD